VDRNFSGSCNYYFQKSIIDRNLPAGNAANIKKCKIIVMKKIMFLSTLVVLIIAGIAVKATNSAAFSQIEIIFSSKAYWDGTTKSCLPRDKGCCLHISLDVPLLDHQIFGDLTNYEGKGVKFTFSKKSGIQQETLAELTKTGKFYLDGDGTLSEELLKTLRLPLSYKISPGYYPYQENGDIITIIFK
jgi:hypothetical protein